MEGETRSGGGSVQIPVASLDLERLQDHARRRTLAMTQGNARYGSARLQMNVVGLLGEYAIEEWLRPLVPQVENIGDAPPFSGAGDVRFVSPVAGYGAAEVQIEVKTARRVHWVKYGRSLNADQVQGMQSSVVMWCIVDDEPLDSVTVDIAGWVSVADIKEDPGAKWIRNRSWQVLVKQMLRPPEELLGWAATADLSPF